MFFEDYGNLEYLEPTDYYNDAWTYIGSAVGEDGELYDLVTHTATDEWRYTNI